MRVVKWLNIMIGAVVVFLALASLACPTYGRGLGKTDILKENLKNKNQALVIAKRKTPKANRENSSVSKGKSKQESYRKKIITKWLDSFAKREVLKKQILKHFYNTGLADAENHKFKLARIEYEKALKVAPNDSDTHYNLAILYDDHLNNKKKAIEHYRAYLRLRPNAQDAAKVRYWIREAQKALAWKE